VRTTGTNRQSKIGTRVIGLSFLIFLCALASAATGQTYSNPLYTPAFPPAGSWFTSGPADPMVVEFEGDYYVYPTGNGFTYQVMYSQDLVHWSGDAIAFGIPTNSPWKTWSLWAPEIERINGRFYLYYTAGLGDLPDQRIGVADADTPLGPFTDRSFDRPLIDEPAIDAECFQDEGTLYLYYVRHTQNPFKLSIWVRKLLDPLALDPDSPPRLCIEPTLGWEAAVTEGPTVIKRDGLYYMFYSAWGASSPNYAVAVATAPHPLGPWVRQAEPYNPVFKRNDAISLWGPGHGDHVIGPDGISDWYVYHHKINPGENFDRYLALDRLVPVARHGSRDLHFTSSGGTTSLTPAPRLPFEYANFEDDRLPASFVPEAGTWTAAGGKLIAPADGVLRIARTLASESLQDFHWEWWLRAADGFMPTTDSTFEFSFATVKQQIPHRVGWQIRLATDTLRFVEINEATGATVVHQTTTFAPSINWSHHSRQLTISKTGNLWKVFVDRVLVASVQHHATLHADAWVRTTAAPATLDGYRQTIAFVEDFECAACTADRWEFLGGTWEFVPPGAADDGYLRQSDSAPGRRIALYRNLRPAEFDLSADFMPVSQTSEGASPAYGLVHNYAGPDNHALVLIDDARATVTATAIVNGTPQPMIDSTVPMPPTFAQADYRNLAVTTDVDTGEFVYSLNGLEVLRRAYPGLPRRGRAGLVTDSSVVRIDRFRFSDATGRPRILVSPPIVRRAVFIADAPPADHFTVANGGGGDGLYYRITTDAAWLTVAPAYGESQGEADEITLSYDITGLTAGTYTADVRIESADAVNSPQMLRVELTVETVAPDFDGDGDVDMEDFSYIQLCFTPPSTPPALPPGCEDADLTGDERVNAADCAILQACLSGSNIFAHRACAND